MKSNKLSVRHSESSAHCIYNIRGSRVLFNEIVVQQIEMKIFYYSFKKIVLKKKKPAQNFFQIKSMGYYFHCYRYNSSNASIARKAISAYRICVSKYLSISVYTSTIGDEPDG